VLLLTPPAEAAVRNVLLITADDLNCDSVGAFACRVPDVTPNIDRLAANGLRFEHAHVTIAVCQPCRSVLFTGRYPHRNGAEGFQPIRRDVPTLTEQTRQAGYLNGIMAKVPHLAPQFKFCWDVVVPAEELGVGRDPQLYHDRAKAFFEQADAVGKPFFLMANSQDPHRPFAGSAQEGGRVAGRPNARRPRQQPTKFPPAPRTYKPEEVTVAGFLPDLPDVRQEMAEYFTSVHRADAIVGAVLKALDETGHADDTLVVFLSDHGMALPFAKTNCYRHSTRTPLVVRLPGVTKPGSVEATHMVSGIDLMPTVLDVLGLPPVQGVDGRSFAPLLRGEPQDGRDHVYTVFHQTSGQNRYEMRSLVTPRFGLVYNAWADGQTVFRNESQAGLTMKAMRAAALKDPEIAARVELFVHRVPQELYDYQADPDALRNLVDDPRHRATADMLRQKMADVMRHIEDPLRERFTRDTGK
jgi:N-sulfoglucosamine sulfohydrolase